MEVKATLNKPYTEEKRIEFIIEYNRNHNYFIEERQDCLVALDYTEEEKVERRRAYLDSLSLTPSDVERALYKAKGMDFEDLKTLIAQRMPQLDMKELAIEFRANNFYRGVEINGMRLIDTVGLLLGYSAEDMDYLFENKELPAVSSLNINNEQSSEQDDEDTPDNTEE